MEESLVAKFEAPPIEPRENTLGIVSRPNAPHTLYIVQWETKEWILKLTSIAHIDELGC